MKVSHFFQIFHPFWHTSNQIGRFPAFSIYNSKHTIFFFKCRAIFVQNFKGENICNKEKSLWKLSEMKQLGVIV